MEPEGTAESKAGDRNVVGILNYLDDIIESVLKHLPMKDLNRVAVVNSKWKKIAQTIKRKRKEISWSLFRYEDVGGVEEQIGNHLKLLSSEPRLALVFSSELLYHGAVSVESKKFVEGLCSSRLRTRAAKQEKIKFTDYLERVLPRSCRIVGVSTDGIVGTSSDSRRVLELEGSTSASCLFIPKLEGVDIYTFTHHFDHEDPEEDMNEIISQVTGIHEDEDVRLILLFSAVEASDSNLAECLVNHYKAVVAGGYTDNLIPDICDRSDHTPSWLDELEDKDYILAPQHRRDRTPSSLEDLDYYIQRPQTSDSPSVSEPSVLGIAFCGSNIRVASSVLLSSVKTPEQIESKLVPLKSAISSEWKTVGFMFACIGRGKHFYHGTDNVESSVFRKVFPNVPLFGFFGNGEIGFDYTAKEEKDRDNFFSSEFSLQMFHSYTTIFVLLSFC